jgi:Flp pilus assembly pilin Flp
VTVVVRQLPNTLRSDVGQTTVEYALITTFVIGLTVVVFAVLESSILTFFSNFADRLAGIAPGG